MAWQQLWLAGPVLQTADGPAPGPLHAARQHLGRALRGVQTPSLRGPFFSYASPRALQKVRPGPLGPSGVPRRPGRDPWSPVQYPWHPVQYP